MVMLGDGADIPGTVVVPGDGCGTWPELAGRVEQRAAQVLQQPEPVGGHGQAAPAAGGTVQDGPDQAQAGGLAGQAADDLGAAAGLAEGPLDEVRMPDPVVVPGGEPQVGGQPSADPGRDQAGPCSGGVLVGSGAAGSGRWAARPGWLC